ncbi:hypothetical protein SCLCIDRAFT_1127225 [Scleroderma citrinum Foug A]|uniref:Uncharacterized protein n=1 Tax=Scleroderma citrinum Foug A TaxID=1036808 RepID=A0A0C2ZYV6_9AGAM|nr:hypothetical protein SCLCIDRAFT_1127225 [Scleroderma citrinum Foug A]
MSLSTIAHISISATTEVEITTPCAETRDRDRNGGKWLVEDPPCSPFLMSTAVAAHLPCCNNVAQAQRCRAATQSLYCRRHHHDQKLVAAPPTFHGSHRGQRYQHCMIRSGPPNH